MSVFPLDTLPLPVVQVIQDYLAIGYKLTSCLGPKPPKPEYQPCEGMLYIASLERDMEPPDEAQWAAPHDQWQPVDIDKLKACREFLAWIATTHSDADSEQVIQLVEREGAAMWARFRQRPVNHGLLRLTIDESGSVRERYVSSTCYSTRFPTPSSLPRVEIPKLEARQTPPGQPTVTDLLELHDVIRVCDWPKGFYGLVVEITEYKRKDLEFFDIGYVSTGADFIPNSRPNRRGEYRNKQLLRKIVAVDGQLRFVYPPAFAKESTIEIVARRVRNRQLKLF
ncbi:hypothetical protein [Allocoleopsis franciscana]|uniref:Uncharacterized protein n=1 Tax=Allocoleopsis franciscana PCC 7113 TaxID=1173027 RepID=K9WQE1_9CYAN|nr:hypothetical protein [Allocoleopsis franciscana]AFZ22021.1 hypothetical protein Mic7113_6441 [Allocoleopsis franciscana PCC 7113]